MNNEKSILITGGTGKIGSVLVKHFLKKGFIVFFTSRSNQNIEKVYKLLEDFFSQEKLFGICVDLEKENFTDKITSFLIKKGIWPRYLINNARNREYTKIKKGHFLPRKKWRGELLMDVIVPYELSVALVNHEKSSTENIINIASMYGVVAANPNLYENPELESPINYSVAKAALIHLTKELAIRFASKGVRVNSISYGGVEGRVTKEFKQRYAKLCPLGRMLKEDEVIGAADFLASDKSVGMTGHNLVIDGGWSVW